jgi:hypothetical protein
LERQSIIKNDNEFVVNFTKEKRHGNQRLPPKRFSNPVLEQYRSFCIVGQTSVCGGLHPALPQAT